MATRDDSPQVVAASDYLLNSTPRINLSRLAVPMLYAGMGIALGTLTGVAIALVSVPAGATESVADAGTARVDLAAYQQLSAPDTSAKDAASPAASSPAATSSTVPSPAPIAQSSSDAEAKPGAQTSPSITPAGQNAAPASDSSDRHPAKRRAHPLVHPARAVLADAPEVVSIPMENEQLSVSETPNPPAFYSEGDITVKDYDASAGTIETSDGRSFAIGTSVTVGNATSWQDYHSSVHYRCGQDGNCMLIRAGVFAPNARLI